MEVQRYPRRVKPPQGMTGTWVQAEGGKWGSKPAREMAADAGTRRGSQGQAVEAGGWVCFPGGRRFAPVEEVGSGCEQKGSGNERMWMGKR